MTIHELKYSNTNTYLIEGSSGNILFDTGWAGTFDAFCRSAGDHHISVQNIDYIIISHFHPDHMGIAQEIAELGPSIIVFDVQKEFIHSSDRIFDKEDRKDYKPVNDEKIKIVSVSDSRSFLKEVGIDGEVVHTPGHSDDSISLVLDDGNVFVGDLNPLYELEMHKGTQIEESWIKILAAGPKAVYYGHANAYRFDDKGAGTKTDDDLSGQVSKIIKYIDKGYPLEKIVKKTKADEVFVQDVMRMYLTHQDISIRGILDRIEIKGK